MTSRPQAKLAIYVLASPRDEESCDAIRMHLKAAILKSAIPIDLIDDFDVPPGTDVEQHQRQVLAADIVLPLISADFIGDDDLYRRNQEVIERYNRNQTTIVPILVRVCLWQGLPFSKLNVLPRNHEAVTNKRVWPNEDEALTEVVRDIDELIAKMTTIVGDPLEQPGETQTGSVAETVAHGLEIPSTGDRGETSASDAPPGAAARASADGRAGPTAGPESAPVAPSTDAAIDAGAAAIEQEDSAAQTGVWAPPHEQSSASTEAAAVYLSRKRADEIEVDWRRSYYRRIFWKRGVALALDYMILLVLPLMLMMIIGVTDEDETRPQDLIVALCMFYLVAPLLEASRWRATPGKRILRLEVTGREGHRISFWRAFVRNILRSLTLYSYVFILPLIYQYFRFKKTKKLFHDEFSSTLIGDRA